MDDSATIADQTPAAEVTFEAVMDAHLKYMKDLTHSRSTTQFVFFIGTFLGWMPFAAASYALDPFIPIWSGLIRWGGAPALWLTFGALGLLVGTICGVRSYIKVRQRLRSGHKRIKELACQYPGGLEAIRSTDHKLALSVFCVMLEPDDAY